MFYWWNLEIEQDIFQVKDNFAARGTQKIILWGYKYPKKFVISTCKMWCVDMRYEVHEDPIYFGDSVYNR